MKRAIKITFAVLLIIAILASIGWYLLKYDPNFTRDILVDQARRAERRGDHHTSARLYDLAYQHSGNDETVAIELARQFRTIGNYTKAEYTLSHAIADGGSIDLYIELCKTYVEQDKLLDAVTMLDNVSDPTIKAQLDILRPEAPVTDQAPGHFSDYISISLQAKDGTIYATSDGSYPSTSMEPYAGPIQLSAGETKLQALVVGSNGLVSPLNISVYTVTGVIEPVTLTDPAIDRAVRQILQVSDDHTLYSNELWTITTMEIPTDAQTLDDLKWLPCLQQLILRGHEESRDLSPISTLTALEGIVITRSTLSGDDLKIIAQLPKLDSLTLSACSLSGIDPLSAATGLTRLDLSDNSIRDLTALSFMPDLTYLDISYNVVDSLEMLSGMSDLTELYAASNMVTTTAPLSGCTSLSYLDLDDNHITSIDGLSSIPGLRTLHLGNNQLTNIDALASNVTIGDLDISRNAITDIQTLSSLTELVLLDFSNNQIAGLPVFSKDSPLVSIDGSDNQLTALDQLGGLSNLNMVDMSNNPGITSISALVDCPLLVEVNVFGTGVTDVSPLTDNDRNVIVKYSPI